MPKVRGRIIRIPDDRTVIINLGRKHGVRDDNIFSILAEPEPVVDPFTGEELGRVSVVKAKVAASQVYDKFTIATTRWTERTWPPPELFGVEKVVDEGGLRVRKEDIQPWKAKSGAPVQVGDVVEVEVMVEEEEAEPEKVLAENVEKGKAENTAS
ncbi:MAG: FlgT C-terminal domain-containing protein [Anaerolineae bacterium]